MKNIKAVLEIKEVSLKFTSRLVIYAIMSFSSLTSEMKCLAFVNLRTSSPDARVPGPATHTLRRNSISSIMSAIQMTLYVVYSWLTTGKYTIWTVSNGKAHYVLIHTYLHTYLHIYIHTGYELNKKKPIDTYSRILASWIWIDIRWETIACCRWYQAAACTNASLLPTGSSEHT